MGFDLGGNNLGGLGGLLDQPDTPTTISTLSPAQQKIQQRIMPWLGKLYTGTRVAGTSTYEQQALNTLAQYLSSTGQYGQQRQDVYGQLLAGKPAYDISPEATTNWYNTYIQPYRNTQFNQGMAGAVRDVRGMGGGLSSSAMNRTLANTAQNFAQQGSTELGGYLRQDELARRQALETAAQRQQQAAYQGEPMRLEQAQMAALGKSLGALPRLIEQAKYDASYQDYLKTIQTALQFLGLTTTGTYMSPQPGLIGQLSTGAGQLADLSANLRAVGTGQGSVQSRQQSGGGGGGGQGGLAQLAML